MNLELKREIKKTFDHLFDNYLRECRANYDSVPYSDYSVRGYGEISNEDFVEAKELAKEDFVENFEEHNNWIDPDDSDYDSMREEIIKFVEEL